MQKLFAPSVNYHLWQPCNMRCRFCFATFMDVKSNVLPKGHLNEEETHTIINLIADHGFSKITFAGGEPTLCPWLPDLIKSAKKRGLTTMIVTNGSKIDDVFLENNREYLDWIAFSIDSLDESTNLKTGRFIPGKQPFNYNEYLNLISKSKQFGYRIKINTVVSSMNFMENMQNFILEAKPERWKILQVLAVKGQNDKEIESLVITDEQFAYFLYIHWHIAGSIKIVPETTKAITGSYLMIDPAGKFFDDTKGTHQYSREILKVGVKQALSEINFDLAKFTNRGGLYDWKK